MDRKLRQGRGNGFDVLQKVFGGRQILRFCRAGFENFVIRYLNVLYDG